MVENSGAIVADAEQQPSFPPNSAPAAVPAAIPVKNSDTPQPAADVRPPSVLPDAVQNPSAAPAPVLVPLDSTQTFLYKGQLHDYTQRSRIPMPVYQTVSEGSIDVPKFRSTVLVDGVHYVSPNTFRNRKGAEHDAARIALEYLSKRTKDDSFLLLQEDLVFCKSILSEYMVKMNLKKPIYTTKHHKGCSIPIFQSTLVFDGVVYTGNVSRNKKEAEQLAARAAILSLIGDAGNPESQNTLTKIVASKVRLHATLQKVKDSLPSQIQSEPMAENTEQQHVGMAVNEDKDIEDASLIGGVVSGAISEVPPTTPDFQPEFRSIKPEAPSLPVSLPIESVPSTLEEPVGDGATGSRKRSKNKRKARKKLRVENQMSIEANQTTPPCSVAQ